MHTSEKMRGLFAPFERLPFGTMPSRGMPGGHARAYSHTDRTRRRVCASKSRRRYATSRVSLLRASCSQPSHSPARSRARGAARCASAACWAGRCGAPWAWRGARCRGGRGPRPRATVRCAARRAAPAPTAAAPSSCDRFQGGFVSRDDVIVDRLHSQQYPARWGHNPKRCPRLCRDVETYITCLTRPSLHCTLTHAYRLRRCRRYRWRSPLLPQARRRCW